MPEVTGPELQTRLRAMNSTVPVIFVTGHADDEMRARALRKGATAFLKKPFSEDPLLDAIRSALNGTVS
jgi:two-component system, LuxR family, response regulator FixJ